MLQLSLYPSVIFILWDSAILYIKPQSFTHLLTHSLLDMCIDELKIKREWERKDEEYVGYAWLLRYMQIQLLQQNIMVHVYIYTRRTHSDY